MERPFFSIIIPVYNGKSNNLPECLSSIWKQPLDDKLYEVICVDDCSTDNTKEYLFQEQKIHKNLKTIYNSENLRQGGAKNVGIRSASGIYILFIDQDDYYHPRSLQECYNFLKNNNSLEILCCDSAWQQRGKESNRLQLNYPHQEVMTGREFVQKNGFPLAPWRMICLKKYILDNHLYFQEKVRIEDIDWGCKLVIKSKKMKYEPILLVHYNRYDTQTTGLMKTNFNILHDQMFAAYRIYEYSRSISEVFIPLDKMWKHHYHVSIRMMLGCYASIRQKEDCIKKYCKSCSASDAIISICYNHSTSYAIFSNMAIPVYRMIMYIFTKIRWKLDKNNIQEIE